MNGRPVPTLLLVFVLFVGRSSGGLRPTSEDTLPKPISAEARYSLFGHRHFDRESIRFAGVTTHEKQELVVKAVAQEGFYDTALVAVNFR